MALITQYWGLDGLIILFFVLTAIYLYFTRNLGYWKKCGVKELTPVPFFGNLGPCLLAQKPILSVFQEMYDAGESEPYIGFYVLDKPNLLIRDPELIKHVLIKDFNYFSNRNGESVKSDKVGKLNLFVVKNPEWRYIRQKLSPIFTSGRLKKMLDLMLIIDKDFDVYLKSLKLEGEGRELEVKEICAKFTTDMIGLTAYGMRFNALNDPDALLRKVGKDIFSKNYKRHIELLSALLIPSFVDLFRFYVFGKGATNFLKKLFWEAMNERTKSNVKRADLIDLLIDLKNDQDNDPIKNNLMLEGDGLIAQAAVFFTGGFETSSSTMSFTLYELAKNPDIQQKLREEILSVLNQNEEKLTYDLIMHSFPYLDMVVAEILRMYPILPFLDRKVEADYQVPGSKLTLKAGTPVIIPMQAIQMDDKYFPKPYIFDPERFSAENKKNITPNTYFPFGDGPRICIGMRLGLLQTKLGLIHLISKYEFSPCQQTKIPIQFDNYTVLTSSYNDIILNVKVASKT